MSGVTLVTATIAGRLSTHMPVRWLIGPGLLLVGIGLLAHDRTRRSQLLDPSDPGLHRGRRRERDGQPPSGVDCGRRRHPPTLGHGLRGQHHLPPDRHRHRHRRLRVDLRRVAAPQDRPSRRRHPVLRATYCRRWSPTSSRATTGAGHRRAARAAARTARRSHPLELRQHPRRAARGQRRPGPCRAAIFPSLSSGPGTSSRPSSPNPEPHEPPSADAPAASLERT